MMLQQSEALVSKMEEAVSPVSMQTKENVNTTSACPEVEDKTSPSRKRKEFKPFQFTYGAKEESASPVKSARLDNNYCDDQQQTENISEEFKKARELLREYRHGLESKFNSPRNYLKIQQRLRKKDTIITILGEKVSALEHIIADHEEKSNGLSTSAREDNSENISPTQKLLNQIAELEVENNKLQEQVLELQAKEESMRRDFQRLEAELSERTPEVRDNQALAVENERLSKALQAKEEESEQKECQLRREIADLKLKMVELEVQSIKEQAKFESHLADTPAMIVVESMAKPSTDIESLLVLRDKLASLRGSHNIIKLKMTQFSQHMESAMAENMHKICAAICTTDERNKELVTKYMREIQLRKRYHNQLVELRGNIRVYCRVRPHIKEDGPVTSSIFTFDPDDDTTLAVNNKGRLQEFELDRVFDENVSQDQMFGEISTLVRSVIDGFNVCIFAYGQTGSGKTYTMEGTQENPGVNQRALQFLYEETKITGWNYTIEASVMEIYNETIRDLLSSDPNTNKLEVKLRQEGGLYVPSLLSVPVKSLDEVNQIFKLGHQNRSTATTNMNERSSRSHCLLCVRVEGVNTITGDQTSGRLNLVDLAGSERVSKSQADGARLKEAQNINKSLSCLGDVINALKNKHSYVPYRNSKLTYLLQESLGGDSKTLMILQASPAETNISESICTLTFGQRVRSVELGTATRRVEEVAKRTPSAGRRPATGNNDTPGTPHLAGCRTPNTPKLSNGPTKTPSSRLK